MTGLELALSAALTVLAPVVGDAPLPLAMPVDVAAVCARAKAAGIDCCQHAPRPSYAPVAPQSAPPPPSRDSQERSPPDDPRR